MAHRCGPSSRTDRACTQKLPGVLSRVMAADGSSPPKKKAFQLDDIERTAAA